MAFVFWAIGITNKPLLDKDFMRFGSAGFTCGRVGVLSARFVVVFCGHLFPLLSKLSLDVIESKSAVLSDELTEVCDVCVFLRGCS